MKKTNNTTKDKGEETHKAVLQGQQQGGNHGGGGLNGGKFGNQTKDNTARIQQNDQGGDLPGGRKGKK